MNEELEEKLFNEYRKGFLDGLKKLDYVLDKLELDDNFSIDNARELLRDNINYINQ